MSYGGLHLDGEAMAGRRRTPYAAIPNSCQQHRGRYRSIQVRLKVQILVGAQHVIMILLVKYPDEFIWTAGGGVSRWGP